MIMPERLESLYSCTSWARKHLKRDDLCDPSLSLLQTCESPRGCAPSRVYSAYKYPSFPLAIVQWNALPESVVTSSRLDSLIQSKKTSNDQEMIQSDPTSYPQNQKGNN